MLARLARVLLVVALLAGWQAALVHPVSHVDERGGLVHLDGHGHQDDHPGSSEKTALCDVLAALTACAPDRPAALHVFEGNQPSLPGFATARYAAEPPPFLAQGPPALL